MPHNVTPASGGAGSKTSSKKGYTFTKTFTKAGTFKYVCTIHSSMKVSVKRQLSGCELVAARRTILVSVAAAPWRRIARTVASRSSAPWHATRTW